MIESVWSNVQLIMYEDTWQDLITTAFSFWMLLSSGRGGKASRIAYPFLAPSFEELPRRYL